MAAIPQLDQRMREERDAIESRLIALRARLREDLRELRPREQLRRHPGAVIAAAAVAGLVAGRIAAGLARLLWP